MKTTGLLLCSLFLGLANGLLAQTAHQWLRKGDQEYLEQRYADSESNYRKALERKNSPQGQYNLGNSIYQQKRYQEALTRYENAAKKATTSTDKAAAYHNLGNTLFQLNELDKSINAFKQSLRLNPNDKETKFNLALAQQRKKQEEQQKQRSSSNDDKNKDQNQQQPQSNQGQKPNQDPKQNQNPQQNQGQPQDRQEQAPPPNLSQKEAQNLLKIMDDEERKVQGKMKRAQGKPKSGKDW